MQNDSAPRSGICKMVTAFRKRCTKWAPMRAFAVFLAETEPGAAGMFQAGRVGGNVIFLLAGMEDKLYICMAFHTEVRVEILRGMECWHNWKRRLLGVWFWVIQNFAAFDLYPAGKATVDVCVVCYILCHALHRCETGCEYGVHIGVGFCVARSGCSGQCEGLESRGEWLVQTPALFLYAFLHYYCTSFARLGEFGGWDVLS